MARNLSGKYYLKRYASDAWTDVTTMFDGVNILAIDGFSEEGDAVNVYTEQWIDSQDEDFMVTKQVQNEDKIVRKNVDLSMTFIAGERYATNAGVDTETLYQSFVDYIARNGAFYIRSRYTGMEAHVVCLKSFKPTTQRLRRGNRSYVLATATLHCLSSPTFSS